MACRNAKGSEKAYKLADSGGLFLLVKPTGYRVWCWKYRLGPIERKLTIGSYPALSLKDARTARDRARALVEQGSDPAVEKKRRKAAARFEALDSFEKIARAWHKAKLPTLTPRYAQHIIARLENDIFPIIGHRPVGEITPPEMLEIGRKIQARGARDLAHRVINHASEIFVWAIASGLCSQDPAAIIRKALDPIGGALRPARTRLDEARDVLRKTEEQQGVHWATLLASRLTALTAARPGMVRMAERSEFEGLDGEQPIWRVPAAKMKLKQENKRNASYDFVIPLAEQAVQVIQLAFRASASPTLLFPGVGSTKRPISDSTLSKLYREAGFEGRHVPHGWRATFSTIMNERAAIEDRDRDRAIIDLMLAHVQGGVEAAYNRASYMPRRRELAQAWADLLLQDLAEPELLLPDRLR